MRAILRVSQSNQDVLNGDAGSGVAWPASREGESDMRHRKLLVLIVGLLGVRVKLTIYR
jgi:hypothetical protein